MAVLTHKPTVRRPYFLFRKAFEDSQGTFREKFLERGSGQRPEDTQRTRNGGFLKKAPLDPAKTFLKGKLGSANSGFISQNRCPETLFFISRKLLRVPRELFPKSSLAASPWLLLFLLAHGKINTQIHICGRKQSCL